MNGQSLNTEIANNPFFQGLRPEHVAIIAEGAVACRFGANEFLIHEGEHANRFFLITGGKVALEAHELADGTIPLQTIGAGEVLGWSWLFPPFVWHFQARATEPTEAIVLDGAHLLIAAERDHDFGYELMKRVAQIVMHRLQTTREQVFRQYLPAVGAF